jgi:hypothetical protein
LAFQDWGRKEGVMNQKVRQVLAQVLEQFRTGDIPKAIAFASYPRFQVPSNHWSLTNRILMVISGTEDARGFQQWQQVNRFVRKGARAIYILVPYLARSRNQETGDFGLTLRGFIPRPVFRLEDTEGEALEYQQLELPELPLLARAQAWGIAVKAVPGNYHYQGYYSPNRKEIALATQAESVFFHELAHVAHEKVRGQLTQGQDPFQEIVAELAAAVLSKLVGKDPRDSLGNSYRYIASYAAQARVTALSACIRVIAETEEVVNLIVKGGEPADGRMLQPQDQGRPDPDIVPVGQGRKNPDDQAG